MIGPHNNVFEITDDPMHIRYQWSASYGLIVNYENVIDSSGTTNLLNKHIEKLTKQNNHL